MILKTSLIESLLIVSKSNLVPSDKSFTFLFKDDPDSADFIKYWYKPYPQLMLLHEGLKLIDQKWEDKEIDITYEKNYTDNKGTVIDLKSYKKKPPGNNDGDNA